MSVTGPRRRLGCRPSTVLGTLLLLSGHRSGAGEGAPVPPATPVPIAVGSTIDWARERQFWSFHSPTASPRPVVQDSGWVRQPLDAFVRQRMEARGLRPAEPLARAAWLRRVTLDLTGLAPTPAEVDAFVADRRPNAEVVVVDRLLGSPRYGERLASLWLPLARYAEDQAHQVGEDTTYFYANAWYYREWVIQALNRDLPYDRFLQLQLAADCLPGATTNDLPALGFLGLGPKYYDRDRLAVQADEWEDRIDTVCRTMLGLTVACARCHDHKFEPITQADYYALAGVFASTRMLNQSPDGEIEKPGTTAAKMRADTLHIVAEGEPKDVNLFLRGNVETPGPMIGRRFLQVLSGDSPRRFVSGSGRRELAEAITQADNPLTARVIVNRIWGQLMGSPLVPTLSNFGHSGTVPTNPELLDDLALRFVDHGWSIKALIREMVLSATYRQSSVAPANQAADPENLLHSRMPRRRLSIEQWRDCVLQFTGELDLIGGRSTNLEDPDNHRRTVYSRISRLKLNDLLLQFDYPDANVHAEKRGATTTAIQKLFLLNSPFMVERARRLAARAISDGGPEDSARVRWMYRLIFGRTPDAEEVQLARDFLRRPAMGELTRWQQYAQTLLVSNELFYVD